MKAESIPWDILLVDIIVPYKIRIEVHDKPILLEALTIIDLTTGWLKII